MNGFEMIFWYWWVLAVVLLAIELLATGFFFLWMAFAAIICGFVLLVIPATPLEVQVFIFSVCSFISIILWRRYFRQTAEDSDHPLLNKRGAQYIGRTFSLIEAIENGTGKIKVDDTLWKVKGEDCPVNSKVKVIDVDGTVFIVEKVD